MTVKKTVLQLGVHEERIRRKAFVKVSRFPGVNSITIDDKTGKMTVVGEVDIPVIVMKLKKICNTEIVLVEDVKRPEKKPEPAKPELPKPVEGFVYPSTFPYQYQYSYPNAYYQPYVNSRVVMEEPNACVIM